MDIVLVNPRDPVVDTYMFDSVLSRVVEMVPLGLLYLATVLKNKGYSAEIIDLNTIHSEEERKAALDEVARKKPKIIGFSAMTPCYPNGVAAASYLRPKLKGDSVFIWGGYHVTFLPEAPLRSGMADIVVRGEGENILGKLADMIVGGDKTINLYEIEGISFVENGHIRHNNPAIVRLKNLDSLPYPDRSFINPAFYSVPGTIIASRGCVGNCQFCAAGSWGTVQSRTAENIFEEIEMLQKTGFPSKHLFFVDNCFIGQKERLCKIFTLLAQKGIDLSFSLEARVNSINEEIIRSYHEHNVLAIQFGVESGNREILKRIKKGITLEQVENVIKLCIQYKIIPYCSFIIGHPEDTEETIRDTINLAKKLKNYGAEIGFSVLTPYPGTEIFFAREKLGIEILDWNYRHWDARRTVIRTKHLSRHELSDYFKQAVIEVRSI